MQIEVTDGRLHRIERVRKAVRIATTIAGLSDGQIDHLINRITEDHGRLTVFWHHPPSDLQRRAFALAWVECKETAERVTHHP